MSQKEASLESFILSLVEYMTKSSFPLCSPLLLLQLPSTIALLGSTSFYYTLPWLYMALIDSVVATMAIVTGPCPLRARTTS